MPTPDLLLEDILLFPLVYSFSELLLILPLELLFELLFILLLEFGALLLLEAILPFAAFLPPTDVPLIVLPPLTTVLPLFAT